MTTKLIPDPHHPGSYIDAPITPPASSPHYVIAPIGRETFGVVNGVIHYSPLWALLEWARDTAGWGLSFADVAINPSLLNTLRAAVSQWIDARKEMGFLHEDTTVSLGVEGVTYPFINPHVPAGHVLLMRRPG